MVELTSEQRQLMEKLSTLQGLLDDPNLTPADRADIIDELKETFAFLKMESMNMADGGAVKPSHPLNRRMFREPIRAQAGTYVPTINDIMSFYRGGFDDTGTPLNTEDFLKALEAAKLVGSEGLFPNPGQGFSAGITGLDFGDAAFSDKKEDQIKAIAEQLGVPIVANQATIFGKDFDISGMGSGAVPQGDGFQALIDQSIAEQAAGDAALAATEAQTKAPTTPVGADDAGITALSEAPEEEKEDTVKIAPFGIDTTRFAEDVDLPLNERLEKDSQSIIDVFDSINSEAGGEAFTEGFKSTNKALLFNALRALNAGKEAGGQALQEAQDFAKGVIANIAPSEAAVKEFNDAFQSLTGFNLTTEEGGVESFSPIKSAAEAVAPYISDAASAIKDTFIEKTFDEEGDIKSPVEIITDEINNISDSFKAAGENIERNKRILATDYLSLNEEEQKIKEDLESNPELVNQILINSADKVKTAINSTKDAVNNVVENLNAPQAEKNDIKNQMDEVSKNMDFILDQYQKGEITKDKFEDLMNAENDKLNDLQSNLESQSSSISTGTITEEDAAKTDEVEKEEEKGTGVDTETGISKDKTGTTIVDGTTTDSGVSGAIARALEASGFNLGYQKDPDSDALKTVYYGLQLMMTPGEPLDAAAKVASDALRNEINERYKTKAQQQKFRGEIFKVLLSGEIDLLKEQIKKDGKVTKQSRYNIGSVKENAPTILSSITQKTNLSFDSDALEDPNSIESLYVTSIYNNMQAMANKAYNAGEEIPSLNQLALDSIDQVNSGFLFQKKEPGMFGKILGFIGFGDDEQKTELAGVKTSGSGTGQKVTNQMIDTLAKANNLPRDQIIALLKAQRPDLDFSGIS
jgi:hypothetical protein